MTQPLDSLRLLGAFQLRSSGREVTLGQSRLEELTALLAIQAGEPVSRAQIAYQFWPESSEKQARANVRNILYRLKQVWPDLENAITIDSGQITWRSDSAYQVDVQRFEELSVLISQSKNVDERIRLLTDAANCYQGDLLPTCYADWALSERERLRAAYAMVLGQLVERLLDQRQYEDALRTRQGIAAFRSPARIGLSTTHAGPHSTR